MAGLPRLDDTIGQCFGTIGQRPVIIDADDATESTADWASSHRIVETEEGWRRATVFNVTLRAMETVGKMVGDKCFFLGQRQLADRQFSFAEVVGLFTGLDESGAIALRGTQSILDNGEALGG